MFKFTVLETPEQGQFGSSCQVHLLQSQRRDGFHRPGERRVYCPAGQLPYSVGQEERPQCCHSGHKVGHWCLTDIMTSERTPAFTASLLIFKPTYMFWGMVQVQSRQSVSGSGFSGKCCGLLRPFSGAITQQDWLL